jgi:hypothetical protein
LLDFKPAQENLCPDGRHHVAAAPNAAGALGELTVADRGRLIDMLCDIAEVAALAPSGVDLEGYLSLRLGRSRVLYSIDGGTDILIHHVVPAEAVPGIALTTRTVAPSGRTGRT